MARQNTSAEAEIARLFFEQLFGEHVCQEASIVMWSPVKGVDVIWKSDITQAAGVAVDRALRIDSYFEPCLHNRELVLADADKRIAGGERIMRSISARRGCHNSAVLMPGVWADIDTMDGTHAGKDGKIMPPTRDAVIEVLRGMACKPTVVVDTGGGVHAYWLFEEPWVLETDEDRIEARNLNYAWQQGYVLGVLEQNGWNHLDSTHDLARVLRVPGTMNRKYEPPREVRCVAVKDGKKYHRDDLLFFLPEKIGPAPNRNDKAIGLSELPLDCELPSVVPLLIGMDETFGAVWSGRRRYKSQSERDLAIARMLFCRGATAGDVLRALIVNRAERGSSRSAADKGIHYYETTMGMAAEAAERDVVLDDVVERAEASVEQLSQPGQKANDVRASLLGQIGRLFGLKGDMSIIGIECVSNGGSAQRTYTLVTSYGRVDIGNVNSLISEKLFDNALVDVFRIIPTKLGKKWSTAVDVILALIEDVDLGQDVSENGQTQAYLQRWVEDSIPPSGMVETNKVRALGDGLPWINEGRVYIAPLRAFDRIVRNIPNNKMTAQQFAARLRAYGATITGKGKTDGRDTDGRRQNYDVWELPYDEKFWRPA